MKKLLFLLGFLTILSCKTTSEAVKQANAMELEQLVKNQQFQVELDFAQPLMTNSVAQLGNAGLFPPGSTAGRISLIGNEGIFKMDKDSVMANLPYYGERQMGGGYNPSDTGINFDTLSEDYSVKKNDKQGYYTLSFDAMKNTESFQVTLRMYPNKDVQMTVNSAQRRVISYLGRVVEFDEN